MPSNPPLINKPSDRPLREHGSGLTARTRPIGRLAALSVIIAAVWGSAHGTVPETQFLAENQAAMASMMAGMDVKASGNVDRDFALMMVAHHQGAIDMARAELRHGADETLRRLAQGIIVEQKQEIAVMQRALAYQHAARTSP